MNNTTEPTTTETPSAPSPTNAILDGCHIAFYAQYGEICYSLPNGNIKHFTGWMMLSLDRRTVVARKFRGRNWWQLTSTDSVYWTRFCD